LVAIRGDKVQMPVNIFTMPNMLAKVEKRLNFQPLSRCYRQSAAAPGAAKGAKMLRNAAAGKGR
jgi:hypothetical protein